jgi:hypothetical protein
MKFKVKLDQTPPSSEQIMQARHCADMKIIRWKFVAAFIFYALMMLVGMAKIHSHILLVCFAACVGGVWGRVTQLNRQIKSLKYLPGASFL